MNPLAITKWRVLKGGKWFGIIETNYAWAYPYWRLRGYTLEPLS